MQYEDHIILENKTIHEALGRLNSLNADLTLFVISEQGKMIGTLTDGDIRRGLISGSTLAAQIISIMKREFQFLQAGVFSFTDLDRLRKLQIKLVPILDPERRIIKIVSFDEKRSILPVDAVIMAGGEGKRLRPLTESAPKPLLKVGGKPIIKHNIDRLAQYGVEQFHISVNYLKHQIIDYLQGANVGVSLNYVHEQIPLGTIGALAEIESFTNETILVMNSDLLTNIDFEDFYRDFIDKKADVSVATFPYLVTVPFAVVETKDEKIISLKEKPTYTYYSNAGIYLFKRELKDIIPKGQFYNATDFVEHNILHDKKVIYYPIRGYWLDIGNHDDYGKAQEDITHLIL